MAKKIAKKKTTKVVKAAPKKAATKTAVKVAAKTTATTTTPKTRALLKPKNTSTNSYTYSEFVENVRGFCGLPKRSQAKEIASDLAQLITDALKKGYKIPLLGLGKLYVRQTKARIGRNPATGAEIQIPARKRIRFTAAKSLKEAIL